MSYSFIFIFLEKKTCFSFMYSINEKFYLWAGAYSDCWFVWLFKGGGGGDIFLSLSFSTSFALSENVVMRCGENAPPPRWICPCFWQTRRSWYKTLIFNFLSNIRNNQQRRLWHVFSIKPVGSVKSSSVITYVCRACPLP